MGLFTLSFSSKNENSFFEKQNRRSLKKGEVVEKLKAHPHHPPRSPVRLVGHEGVALVGRQAVDIQK